MAEKRNSSHVDDEDDPVVKEIPVYLSKSLENQLYLFQYPLWPKDRKTRMDVRKAFFKPQNQEVKLEMNLNVNSNNFDVKKAKYIAQKANKAEKARDSDGSNEDEVMFENGIVDKVVMTSTKAVEDTGNYAIGAYNGKEFHLTPLKGFLQLHPSMDHLDKAAKGKAGKEAEPSIPQAVVCKVADRHAYEEAEIVPEISYSELKAKRDAEKWIQCNWCEKDGFASEMCKTKLFSESSADLGQAMNVTPSEYLRVLIPKCPEM